MSLTPTLASCGEHPSAIRATGLPYTFPQSHVEALLNDNTRNLYIRIRPPQSDFWLILDYRSDRLRQETSSPAISGIHGLLPRRLEHVKTNLGEVYCKDTPYFGCGSELYDGNMRWSLVFHRSDLSSVQAIRQKAKHLLENYRASRTPS